MRSSAERDGDGAEPGDGAAASFGGAAGRLVVVSNRLPVRVGEEDGKKVVRPASGGLVTALEPVLSGLRGAWIGWDGGELGGSEEALRAFAETHPYRLAPVSLEPELVVANTSVTVVEHAPPWRVVELATVAHLADVAEGGAPV